MIDGHTPPCTPRVLSAGLMAGELVARLPSSRHADVVYEVRLEDGLYTCDCPGFGFRKKCRHVTALEALKALPMRETVRTVVSSAQPQGAPWEL